MQPPDRLIKKGIDALPTLGDGRQSGTSASPSILHVSPESAVGGNIGILKTGDKIKINLNKKTVNVLISKSEFKKRKLKRKLKPLNNQTPWQELSRLIVGQLEDGACINTRSTYVNITKRKGVPRHSH
jgi:dihydroxy-acid dehydratase